MKLQLAVRNLKLSEARREDIHKKAEGLGKYFDRLMRCRVVVEVPHRHSREALYNIEIEMRVPGAELIVKRQPNADLDAAVRDAFDSARRQLEDFARKFRGAVKHHEGATQGEISVLYPDGGYGYIKTPDGREIYFHGHSVVNKDFGRLRVGEKVRFVEEQGEKGPQASTVTVED